jgi:hypothetical protein
MLANYTRLPNGVIKQIDVRKITYDYNYSNKYNSYGEKGNYLSYLRYGVLLGVIKDIPKRLVDVGYGNGDFLHACKRTIPELYGCDISEYPVPHGCTKIATLDEIKDIPMDVICFFDSLEHFDSIDFVKDLNTEYVYISVPWCHYVSDTWFKDWYHRRENEHIYHFNKESLIRFFDECDYDCLYTGNHEDTIRFNSSVHPLPNILSAVFKKRR